MQKKPTPTFRDSHDMEPRHPFPPEPKYIPENYFQNNNSHQQRVQNSQTPPPQANISSGGQKSHRRAREEKSPRENYQEAMRQSMQKKYSNSRDAFSPEERINRDTADFLVKLDTQHSIMSQSKGFDHSMSHHHNSQEFINNGGSEDQYQQLLKQNEDLKKQLSLQKISLHNETLTNEEQRAYIEVLKEALETKLKDNGLLNFVKSINQRGVGKEADIFLEMANMKAAIDGGIKEKEIHEEQLRELNDKLNELTLENDQLKEENEWMNNEHKKVAADFEKAIEDLEIVRNQNDKLMQEKNSLLDYVEDMNTKYEELNEQSSTIKESTQTFENKIAKAQTRNKDLTDQLAEYEEKNYNIERELEEMNKKYNTLLRQKGDLQKKYEELHKQHSEDTETIEQLNEDLKQVKKEYQRFKKDHDNTKETHSELEQNLSELEQAHRDQSNKLKTSMESSQLLAIEKEELLKKIQELMNKNSEQVEIQDQLQEKVVTLSQEVIQYKEEVKNFKELEQANLELTNEMMEIKNLFEDNKAKSDKDRQVKAEEIKLLYQQSSDLRIELRNQKESYQTLKSERDGLEANVKDLKQEIDKKQKLIVEYSKEINDLRHVVEEKQEQVDLKMVQIEKFESQIDKLNMFVEECDEKMKRAYDAEEDLTRDLEKLTKENKKIKEENTSLRQKLEKAQFENEQANNLISDTLGAVGSTISTENLEINFKIINDALKNAKYEEETLKRQIIEIEYEKNLHKDEIHRLNEKNQNLLKNEVDLHNETKKLRSELDKQRDEISSLQLKNERLKADSDKLKEDYTKKYREDERNFKEKAQNVETKLSRMASDKSALEYILFKYKEVTLNGDINDLLEQIKNTYLQILHLDKDKLDLQIKLDLINNRRTTSNSDSATSPRDSTKRRDAEVFKENLAEIGTNTEILQTKKQAAEKELSKILAMEKSKYDRQFELEKQTYQLKAELDIAQKENNLIEQTKGTLEASYNDLLRELRKSRMEEKLNSSYTPAESSWQGSRRFYGRAEFEKTKTGNEDLKRELENLGHLSSEASRKYSHHRTSSGYVFSNLEK